MVTAGFVSLGCAKNLVDTEVMLGILADNEIRITDNPQEADILIVNTCGFIDSAKEESISTIMQMAEYKHGKCRGVIVAGCLGQRYQQELLDELPEISAIIGTGAWHRIMEAVNAVLAGKRVLLIGETDTIYDETMRRITTTPAYSAYVKIAEGCSNCCSYCVIPMVRGKYRSRPVESIVSEVKKLAERGVKEINLIAQDTTSYGHDLYDKPQLLKLLDELVKIEGILWIRLLYCYPKYFSDELIEFIAAQPKICNYIDLPLQHADDEILSAMNRRDTRSDIENLLKKIRNVIPDVTIRTSFIVGFPGEAEQHFESLKNFILEQKFERVGIFTYSQEENTPAALMKNQVPDQIKEDRYHELMSLQCRISEEINHNMEGKILTVLIEGHSPEEPRVAFGRSYREAPEVDGRVYVENASDLAPGDIVRAEIIQGFTYDLLAEKK
ncbi:30S ribosomal protein S12 methylthiotransferase RimO [Sporomusa acidovorans]|uniref:Ribosomal protein uS12 methylthiotransferase RimO n=1 Tax=Sporomusa acidovorans (strain ATCC 49682 / DSM 3132 / Mol) TaxID=1123286 RepID=A0ABZ3J3Y0_SPOA4|nr:30S ribosomal protein S12 methylthiotransferase RimO [Sporomusa acidovorans]OZC20139.1 ribosomal protein S12 methylthiotransferase RimO [Sporomusa acidovorans DSM 3132]SDD44010.1 ribosomal protein S12 methylthiotransferase [Sporomusa acidovorans]